MASYGAGGEGGRGGTRRGGGARSAARRPTVPLVATAVLIVLGVLLVVTSGRFTGHDAAGAAPTLPAQSTTSAAPPTRVEVIGDSLIQQSRDLLATTMTGANQSATIASKPSQPLSSDFIQGAIADAETRPSDVVVLATASNDALAEAQLAAAVGEDHARAVYRQLLTDTITRFPGRCFVVVNARDVSPIFAPLQVALLNEDIQTVAAAHDNVVVVDWATTSRPHRSDWFVADLEHFGPDVNSGADVLPGAQAYADAIAAGTATCAARAV